MANEAMFSCLLGPTRRIKSYNQRLRGIALLIWMQFIHDVVGEEGITVAPRASAYDSLQLCEIDHSSFIIEYREKLPTEFE